MNKFNPLSWWRQLPQKTRVRIIVGICLALAGIEFWFIAPHIIEMSILVDTLGWAFAFAAVRTSFVLWAMQVRDAWASMFRILFALYYCSTGYIERLHSWWSKSGFDQAIHIHRLFNACLCRATLAALYIAGCHYVCRIIVL